MTQGIRIQPHTSHDYATLPKRVKQVSVEEKKCLDELGAYLVQNGMHDRFSISLLHRHFEFFDGEICLATSDAEKQSITVSPVKRQELEGQTITAINCRFVEGDDSTPLKLIGMEYAPVSDLGDVAPISESDAACLQAVYAILVRHDAVDTFGIVLRHIDPRNTRDREWLEDSFDSIRTSVRKLINPGELPKENVGTSAWAWLTESRITLSNCKGTEHFHCVSTQHCASCEQRPVEEPATPETPAPAPEEQPKS